MITDLKIDDWYEDSKGKPFLLTSFDEVKDEARVMDKEGKMWVLSIAHMTRVYKPHVPHTEPVLKPDTTISVGSVVRLKSGGPPMTVTSLIDGDVYCSWFSEWGTDQKLLFNDFPPEALEVVPMSSDVLVGREELATEVHKAMNPK